MSSVLELNIKSDLHNCTTVSDIEAIVSKYQSVFTNAVEASEFNQMVKETKMRLGHRR